MAKTTTIQIKLATYLVRYVCSSAHSNVIQINKKSILGNFILTNLRFPPAGWRPERMGKNEGLVIAIPEHYIQQKCIGAYMNDACKAQVADSIEANYWERLYEYVTDRRLNYGEKELVAMRQFREMHHTYEEDYKEESAYKRYRRIKQRRTMPVIKGIV